MQKDGPGPAGASYSPTTVRSWLRNFGTGFAVAMPAMSHRLQMTIATAGPSIGTVASNSPRGASDTSMKADPFPTSRMTEKLPQSGSHYIDGGFDAPRVETTDSPFWKSWQEFRVRVVANFVRDFAEWITDG